MLLLNTMLLFFSLFVPPAVTGETLIIVNKSTHELVVYQYGEQMYKSKVATGKTKELTPEGEYTVKVKAVDPYYRKKDIPGGDPKNPLGSRWIGFDAEGTDGRIYGVHGTNNPSSIGGSVSAGCIRMKNDEVEKLYTMVEEGSKIMIVDDNSNYEEIYNNWETEQWKTIL
ncbi:L,D-transpeptidase [Halobacillus sp. Marseille-Q1614]|uniref:L,D-transpeptidase n=1 Tax=Halobacillus sp. Marseille-Q1614 TaxID=2709134 RepID=UPI001570D775|nr:L,D-transpeptidase [Halobacillus sp. Marseille-Q1614]